MFDLDEREKRALAEAMSIIKEKLSFNREVKTMEEALLEVHIAAYAVRFQKTDKVTIEEYNRLLDAADTLARALQVLIMLKEQNNTSKDFFNQ